MTTNIIPNDADEFEEKINFSKKNKLINIMCSFTYITPNYDIISSFVELLKFTKNKNTRIVVILWDMNALANPYFKRYCSDKVNNTGDFINQKIKEINGIIRAVGFNEKNIVLCRSSEVWKRLVTYQKENLFQRFFSLLARISVKKYSNLRKASHLFQIVLDIFISAYINKLQPEIISDSIDLLYSDYYKITLYKDVRNVLLSEGYITKKPLFLLMQKVPYMVYEERTPEWDMGLDEIFSIIKNCDCTDDEIKDLLNYFNCEIINFSNKNKVYLKLSQKIHSFLKNYKEKYEKLSDNKINFLYNIKSKHGAIELGQIIKSELSLNILLLSDGNNSIKDIAKKIKKSISTVSQYLKDLKNKGFVIINSEGKPVKCYTSFNIQLDLFDSF